MEITDEDEITVLSPFVIDMHDFFDEYCADHANMEILYAIIRQNQYFPKQFRILHLFYRTRPEGAKTGNFLQEVALTEYLRFKIYLGDLDQEPSTTRTKILRIVLHEEGTLYVELMNHFPLPVQYLTIPHQYVSELNL